MAIVGFLLRHPTVKLTHQTQPELDGFPVGRSISHVAEGRLALLSLGSWNCKGESPIAMTFFSTVLIREVALVLESGNVRNWERGSYINYLLN